jgi:hypothetical protein
MTEQRLTPAQIGEIRQKAYEIGTGPWTRRNTDDYNSDVRALLSHVAALEGEIAGLREAQRWVAVTEQPKKSYPFMPTDPLDEPMEGTWSKPARAGGAAVRTEKELALRAAAYALRQHIRRGKTVYACDVLGDMSDISYTRALELIDELVQHETAPELPAAKGETECQG